MCIIPRTVDMDTAEARFNQGLVAVVGGSKPTVTPAQIQAVLQLHYQVAEGMVQAHRYQAEVFLLVFQDQLKADWVLHTIQSHGAEL
jgi:hypothetical protein